MKNSDINIISKFGYRSICIAAVLFVLSFLFGGAIFFGLIVLFLLFIYRNPEREFIKSDKSGFYAPCDGKIKKIEIKGDYLELSFINSILNAGQVRAPIDGKIELLKFKNGLSLCNFMKSSRLLNNKAKFIFKNDLSECEMILFYGVFSRKLHLFDLDSVNLGQRVAFMVDGEVVLRVPKNTRLLFSEDSNVKAGELIGSLQ